MAWRNARALDTLAAEVRERWPGTTIWTIAAPSHPRPSDHFPYRGVVTAADIVGQTQARTIFDHIVAARDERTKYAIHASQIVSSTTSPWQVRRYTGPNPHTTHVHLSVGRGPNGQTSRPDLYDNPAPWGLTTPPPATVGADMFAQQTSGGPYPNRGPTVEALRRTLVHLMGKAPKGPSLAQDVIQRYDNDLATKLRAQLGYGDGRVYGPRQVVELQIHLARKFG